MKELIGKTIVQFKKQEADGEGYCTETDRIAVECTDGLDYIYNCEND